MVCRTSRRFERQRAFRRAALKRKLYDAYRVRGLFGFDYQLGAPAYRVGDVAVVGRVVARGCLHAAAHVNAARLRVDCAPTLFGLLTPAFGLRTEAEFERVLLRVEAVLDEGAFGAVQMEARPRLAREHRRLQRHAQPFVTEPHVEAVRGLRELSPRPNVRGDFVGEPEQDERLIYQVRAEVVEDAAALPRTFAPSAGARLVAVSVEVRFVLDETAEQPGFENLPHGQEVAVPTPVVVRADYSVLTAREFGQLLRFRVGVGERLLD